MNGDRACYDFYRVNDRNLNLGDDTTEGKTLGHVSEELLENADNG